MTSAAHGYVTYFDQRYLARGLVMIRSLRRHHPDADIFVLCLDDLTHAEVVKLADASVHAIAHADVLAFEPRLEACAHRPTHAYYATHKPILPLYVLAHHAHITRVTHLDADLVR
jgi:hypothetical protein